MQLADDETKYALAVFCLIQAIAGSALGIIALEPSSKSLAPYGFDYKKDSTENMIDVMTATEKGSAPGCLLMCVAPLVDDAEVRQFIQKAAAGASAMMERRFRDGIRARELPAAFPVAARASQVLDLARGLTMRAQMGVSRKTLLKDAENAADLVLLP